MNQNLEVRLSVLLENIGLLIHNGIDGKFSRIDNQNLSRLGHLLCKIQSPGGINENSLSNIEDFIYVIDKDICNNDNPLSFLQELSKELKSELSLKTGSVTISCKKDIVKFKGHETFHNEVLILDDTKNTLKVEFYFNKNYELLYFSTNGFELFGTHNLRVEESTKILNYIVLFFKQLKEKNQSLDYSLCNELIVGSNQ